MPHTWIVWGIYARIVHSRIAIQEMSAVRYPTVLKTSTFSIKDCEKHFQYVCYLSNSTTNLERIFQTNNTLAGHCLCRIRKVPLAIGKKCEYYVQFIAYECIGCVNRCGLG